MGAIRRFMRVLCLLGMAAGLATPCGAAQQVDANFAAGNARLGRGVNMGNMLEAPREGAWGLWLDERYFKTIREAGFDSVRIPIRWSAHAASEPPYAIDANFFTRVDRAIAAALAEGLAVVINVHHYEEVYANPPEQRERFLTLWEQIASRYQDQPPELYFELLNEPHGDLDADAWNDLLVAGLKVVRKTNPQRPVIIGPAQWNNVAALESLKLPEGDERLIVTFHYYLPFHFTHQGASWAEGSEAWLGTRWTGTREERAAITRDFERATQWSEQHGRPIYLGEFGAYSRADIRSRARWTESVRSEAEQHGFSWAYWEFAAGFGVYDPEAQAWREPLLEALVPDSAVAKE